MKNIFLLLFSACLAITGFTSPNMAPPFKAEVLATVKLYDGSIVEKEIIIPIGLNGPGFDYQNVFKEFDTTDGNTLSWKYVDYIKFEYNGEKYHFVSVKKEVFYSNNWVNVEKSRFYRLIENGPCRVFAKYQLLTSGGGISMTGAITPVKHHGYTTLYYIQKENYPALKVTGIVGKKIQKVADYFGDCPVLSKKIREGEFPPNEAIFLAQYYNTFCVEKTDE